MLGDNPEKSKNPLKKAMRRRNAKTVNFAPPTYYEPEERQWSDEEDEGEEADDGSTAHIEDNVAEQEHQAAQQQSQQAQQAQQMQHGQQVQQVDQTSEQQRVQPATATIHRVSPNDAMDEDDASSPVKSEMLVPAPLQTNSQDNVSRSRRGVVRNTDSFFKDEETKKISLTPRLLQNDADATGSVEQEVKQRPSLDTFDKIVTEDKPKDGKKKEKKGMLSGLFKRKDKNSKGGKNDPEESDRISEESGRSPNSKDSMDSENTPERKPSKLQKSPPGLTSPKGSPTDTRAPQKDFAVANAQQQPPNTSQNNPMGLSQQPQPSRLLGPEPQAQQPSRFPSLQEKRSVGAKISDALRSKNSSQDMSDPTIKTVYSKRAKERFVIDESDSEDDRTPTAQSSILHRSISPLESNDANSGRPESALRVSPMDGQDQPKPSPRSPLPEQKSAENSGFSQQIMPAEAVPTSPSDQTASTSKQSPSLPTHTPSTSRSTPTWSDASLRSYMDDDQDIRDLLVIVHDKTNVTPVGPEHPLMNGLFATERTKLAEMQSQLDSMLLSWLSKKNQPVAAKV